MKVFLSKTHNIESRSVIGPKNILFAGLCRHLSAQIILQAGAMKGLTECGTEPELVVFSLTQLFHKIGQNADATLS